MNVLPPSAASKIDSPTGLSEAQKTALITAWQRLISPNLISHSRNIFAKFYDIYPNYLHAFENNFGNHMLHTHSERVFQLYNDLIDIGLYKSNFFNYTMDEIVKRHKEIVNRGDVAKLNEIIKDYLLKILERHMTRTLREAIEVFLLQIESRFHDSFNFDSSNGET